MAVTIEGMDFSLFKEYDRVQLPNLSFRGKLRWFELRVRLVLIRPLGRLRIQNTEPQVPRTRASYMLIHGTLIFSGVEALGGFYAGKDGDRLTFDDFIMKFMDARYHPHAGKLREDFRNGLTHGFTVKNGGFEFNRQNPINDDPNRGLELDPGVLRKNFKAAFAAYVNQVRAGGPNSVIGKNFLKRFKKVFET